MFGPLTAKKVNARRYFREKKVALGGWSVFIDSAALAYFCRSGPGGRRARAETAGAPGRAYPPGLGEGLEEYWPIPVADSLNFYYCQVWGDSNTMRFSVGGASTLDLRRPSLSLASLDA